MIWRCCLIWLFAVEVFAASKPDWVLNTPKESSDYKFYIGRSSNAPNEAVAVREAMEQAQELAIKENFGTLVKLDTQTYDSLNSVASIKRIEEGSEEIRLIDFEQKDLFVELIDGSKANAWVLFRYSKKAIQEEKTRLKKTVTNSTRDVTPQFSEVGSREMLATTLEITSQPSGASVFIDNQREGATPLRVLGQLEVGKHILRLEHPTHDDVEEDFILSPAKPYKINKILKRSFGHLKIESTPVDAFVSVNGRLVNSNVIELPVGSTIKIAANHPEYDSQVQEIVVTKSIPPRTVKFNLNSKPAFFTVQIEPNKHSIELNGSKIKAIGNGQELSCAVGENILVISASGYNEQSVRFKCNGGKTTHLTKVDLSKYVGPSLLEFSQSSPAIFFAKYINTASSISGDDSSISLYGLQMEKASKYFDLLIELDLLKGAFDSTTENIRTNGFRASSGVKIWDRDDLKTWNFQPTIFYLSAKKDTTYNNSSQNSSLGFSQWGFGVDFARQWNLKPCYPQFIFGFVDYHNAGDIKGNFVFEIGMSIGYMPF